MSSEEGRGRRGSGPAPSRSDESELDASTWPAEALASLQAVLDRSLAMAGVSVRDTFDQPQRQLSAAEFVSLWNSSRMKAMATVGAGGNPHIAPVHAEFVGGSLRSTIYEHAVRRRDLRRNPELAFTTWGPNGFVAIVYGRAREVPGSLRETRSGARGGIRRALTLEIEVSRIYAMKPRLETV